MYKKRKILVVIVLIILLLSILLWILFNRKNNKLSKEEISKNGNLSVIYDMPQTIDMTKTENVVIKDNTKYNISKKINKIHETTNFKFEDMKINASGNFCNIQFSITKKSNLKNNDDNIIFITFYNKSGRVLQSLSYHVPEIEVGKMKEEKIQIPWDVSNAYDYDISGFKEE